MYSQGGGCFLFNFGGMIDLVKWTHVFIIENILDQSERI